MQASAPHRNIRHSHPSFNKYPDIARNIQLSPEISGYPQLQHLPSLNTLIITTMRKASHFCEAFLIMYIFLRFNIKSDGMPTDNLILLQSE